MAGVPVLTAPADPTDIADKAYVDAVAGATVGTVPTTLALTGVITPTALAANTDDWAPTGLSTAAVIRATPLSAGSPTIDLTGLTGGSNGRAILLMNVDTTQDLVLKHNVTSTAANRFFCPGGLDFTLLPYASVLLVYDSTASRWRVFEDAKDATRAFAMSGDIASTLSANTDNLSPSSLPLANVIRLGLSGGSWNLTGITGGRRGRVLFLLNTSSTLTATLMHDVTSTAANRFLCPSNTDFALGPNGSVLLVYDSTASRWRVIAIAVGRDALVASQSFALTGVIAPTTISASVNDWAPTGLATSSIIRAALSGGFWDLTGLTGGSIGRVILLENLSTTLSLTLKHESASSTAANRFLCPSSHDYVLGPGDTLFLVYDATDSRWRVISGRRQLSGGYFGSGIDGPVTISGPTTLTRDMHYTDLVVNDVLNCGGFHIFISGTLSGTGSIVNPGGDGGAGGDATSGAAGGAGAAGTAAAAGPGTASAAGLIGKIGVRRTTTQGQTAGTAGTAAVKSIYNWPNQPAGKAGGDGTSAVGTGAGGAAAAGATSDDTGVPTGSRAWRSFPDCLWPQMTVLIGAKSAITGANLTGQAASGSSGGVASVTTNTTSIASGGSGGSGAAGGPVVVSARTISGTTLTITSAGAIGGAAGAPFGAGTVYAAGGSSGGNGGAGGILVLIYGELVSGCTTAQFTAPGGLGGALGAGLALGAGTSKTDGTQGNTGPAGVVALFQMS